jgi:acetyl esterase/lipase
MDNYELLNQIVEEKAVIRHVSKHRNPDGSMDVAGNLKIWNDAVKQFDSIKLWDITPNYDDRDKNQIEPNVIFIHNKNNTKSGTIIVACGGGFETRTGCEGFNVAKRFVDEGFNCAILTYRLKPYSRKDAMDDMQRAIRLLRFKQDELNINDKICCMGFSAGGMLSGNCATHFDSGNIEDEDFIEHFSSRPDAVVIGYGAFCFSGLPQGFFNDPFSKTTHNPFFASNDELHYYSPEINIKPDSPPFFIWQTNSDDPRNSFAMGSALTAMGIPFEMHLFPEGVHGLALADGNNDLDMNIPSTAQWVPLCVDWLHRQGI